MDPPSTFPHALIQLSPSRTNQSVFSPTSSTSSSPMHASPSRSKAAHRDSTIADRAAYFDTLAFQSKTLERRTADAALKRAMIGREEAESEMRRYRDEARSLRKTIERDGAEYKKAEERYKGLVEEYRRAKESSEHARGLWEKEIRRSRKEAWKSQSAVVKVQEELKGCKTLLKAAQGDLDRERERVTGREQEAFAARYEIVGVEEELARVKEQLRSVEQERDALKLVAKNEEIERIAAEGKLPLPLENDEQDEFASPTRKTRAGRLSLTDVASSAVDKEEIEELREEVALQRYRAEQALDHLDFVKLECYYGRCNCRLAEASGKSFVQLSIGVADVVEYDGNMATLSQEETVAIKVHNAAIARLAMSVPVQAMLFAAAEPTPQSSPWISPTKKSAPQAPASQNNADYARTPSVEPPGFAQINSSNASLMSLVEAVQNTTIDDESDDTVLIRSTASPKSMRHLDYVQGSSTSQVGGFFADTTTPVQATPPKSHIQHIHRSEPFQSPHFHTISTTTRIPIVFPEDSPARSLGQPKSMPSLLPSLPIHRSTNPTRSYHDTNSDSASETVNNPHPESFGTPGRSDHRIPTRPISAMAETFAPTVSKEEPLAMIRERRGRARSAANGTATPRKQMVVGLGDRRDASAPAGRGLIGGGMGAVGSRSLSRGRLGPRSN